MTMEERFAADRNLGTLAKWLRILGYDALLNRASSDENFLGKAAEEGRIVLTRKRDLARLPYPGKLVVVNADHAREQLDEIISVLALEPDPARRMTRCLMCNVPLEEVAKETVAGLVPAYVYETCPQFRRCTRCGKIYWPGTHVRRVEERLRHLVSPRRTDR